MNGAEPSPPKRPRYRSALIIDPDLKFVGSVRSDPLLANREFDLATGGRSAEMLLRDQSVRYSAIFIDSGVHSPTLLTMLHEIRERHPATPVFLFFARSAPFSERELRRLGIQECVKKPFTAQDLASRTQPPRPAAPQPTPVAATQGGFGGMVAQGAAGQSALDDSGYRPILAEEFLSGRPSPFDAYVRVAPGQYIRVLNAKDSIEPERVQRFISLGATHLFVRKQPLQRCLGYCELLSRTLAARADVSFEIRLLQLASQGEEVAKLVRALGGRPLSPAILAQANAFLAQLALLIRRAKRSQKELAQEFLKNTSAIEHSISVTFVAALLSTELGIESPAIWAQLGLAAFFHDVGLYELPEQLIALDTSGIPGGVAELLTPAELQRFQQHPIRSVELLSVNPLFEAATLQSILQHHERRDSSGFPRRLGPDQITPMAEIVGISDEFIRLLKRQEIEPEFKALAMMEAEVFNGFSFRTIKAFRAVFM